MPLPRYSHLQPWWTNPRSLHHFTRPRRVLHRQSPLLGIPFHPANISPTLIFNQIPKNLDSPPIHRFQHRHHFHSYTHLQAMSENQTSPPAKRVKTTDEQEPTTMESCPALQIKKLSDKARIPTRGSAFSAGYDLYAAKDTTVPARGKVLVDTDISIALPAGTCKFPPFFTRSILSLKMLWI